VLTKGLEACVALAKLVVQYAREKHGVSQGSVSDHKPASRLSLSVDPPSSLSAAATAVAASSSAVDLSAADAQALLDVSTVVMSTVDIRKREVVVSVLCRAAELLRRLGHVQMVGASRNLRSRVTVTRTCDSLVPL
jgi:hypothetical protein